MKYFATPRCVEHGDLFQAYHVIYEAYYDLLNEFNQVQTELNEHYESVHLYCYKD